MFTIKSRIGRHLTLIILALLLFLVMFTVNNQLVRASLIMDGLLDAFEPATAKWTESRILLTLDRNLSEEQQMDITGNLTDIIRFLSSPDIVRLGVFTDIDDTAGCLEAKLDTLVFQLPIQYKAVNPGIIENIESEMASVRNMLRDYRQSLNEGFFYLVQAQVILIFLLLVFMVIAMMDRSQQRMKLELGRRVQGEISGAQERERHRIALELHDDIAQELSWLRLNLDSGETLTEKRVVLDNLLVRLRDLSQSLRWPDFSIEPFGASLRDLIELTERRSAVVVSYIPGEINPGRQPLVYGHLYRIVQECLNNAGLHAGACRCYLEIQEEEHTLFFDYRDDGAGFDVKEALHSERIGLKGIRYRVLLLNGKLKIDSGTGKGTTISVRIPLDSEK